MRKRKLSILTAAVLLTAIILAACSSTEKKPALLEPPDTTGNPVEAFGSIQPAGSVAIAAEIPFKLVKLLVTEGQPVRHGDPLAAIDLTQYKDSMKKLRDEINKLEKELKQHHSTYQNELTALKEERFPDIQRMKNNLAGASLEFTAAEKNYALKQSLSADGSIPSGELEEARLLTEQKKNGVRDAELLLESWKASKQKELEEKATEIADREDQLAELRPELEQLTKKLDNGSIQGDQLICTLQNGIVSAITCKEGLEVNAAAQLFELLDTGSLAVEAKVDEQFIRRVKPGAIASIIPDADKSLLFTGKVTFISSLAVTSNGETIIPVRISLDNPGDFLMPGLNVTVKIDVQK